MKPQLTIGKKIYLSFTASLGVSLVVAVVALSTIGSLGKTVDGLVHQNARRQFLASQMELALVNMLAAERGIEVRAFMKDSAAVERFNREFLEDTTVLTKQIEEFRPLIATEEGRRTIQNLADASVSIAGVHEEVYKLAIAGNAEASAAVAKDKMVPLVSQTGQNAHRLLVLQSELMAKVISATADEVSTGRSLAIAMIGLALAIGIVVVAVVRKINLNLRLTAQQLRDSAGQVTGAASQVASSSQSAAQGSSEQAASLEETSSSTEEINSMASKNSENSRRAAELVTQSQEKFVQVNQSLDQSLAAMGEIKTQSDKISKIIKVIDEIAFQTNILALNAAVEAARAGEAGMGFAVVADEVRNLAQRSAQAARDTAELIEESITKSRDGELKVDQVAAAIRAITEDAAHVRTLVDEVNLGSQEQARGVEQIGKAITQMERVTQGSAASAEQSAAAAEELKAQAQTLKGIVEQLTAMVGGGDGADGYAGPVQRKRATANGIAPHWAGEASAGLSALGNAVSQRTRSAVPVPAAHRSSKEALPSQEEF